MHHGMTGTRNPDDALKCAAISWLMGLNPEADVIVTGGCIGMDAIVGALAHTMGFRVHVVLPSNHKQVDPNWKEYATTHVQMAPRTSYRDRNIKIVESSDTITVFAQYDEDDERSKRSGTWMTKRIAVARRVPVRIYMSGDE